MPKMKTKAGAKKRFKLTGSGKLKRKQAFKSHILTKKETKLLLEEGLVSELREVREANEILNKLYLALPAALHKIHYDIPENRNFYLANKKNTKYITTFNGKNKIFKKSNQMKDKICSKIMSHLEEWFNTYQLKLLKNKKKELSKLFASYYNGELDDKYFDEIEMFLLSYSNDIKENVDATIKKIKIEKVKQSLEKQTTPVIDETDIQEVD